MPKVGDKEFPYTPEGEAAAAEEAAVVADESKEMEAAVGGTAPMATEPLEPTRVNALADTLMEFVMSMAGGQVQLPEIPPIDQAVEQLPPSIYAALVAIAAFLEQTTIAGAEQYKFEPADMATDNDGLAEVASILSAMMADEKFKQQLTATPAAEPEPAPEAASGISDEDLAALV